MNECIIRYLNYLDFSCTLAILFVAFRNFCRLTSARPCTTNRLSTNILTPLLVHTDKLSFCHSTTDAADALCAELVRGRRSRPSGTFYVERDALRSESVTQIYEHQDSGSRLLVSWPAYSREKGTKRYCGVDLRSVGHNENGKVDLIFFLSSGIFQLLLGSNKSTWRSFCLTRNLL